MADADADELGRRLSTAVVLFHDSVGRHLGLSAADQRALALIARHQPLSATAIAELTGLSRASVTGLLDRLERTGHISREADPGDRRKLVVVARPVHQPEVARAFAELAADMQAALRDFSPEQLATIQDYVERTITVLERQTRRLQG